MTRRLSPVVTGPIRSISRSLHGLEGMVVVLTSSVVVTGVIAVLLAVSFHHRIHVWPPYFTVLQHSRMVKSSSSSAEALPISLVVIARRIALIASILTYSSLVLLHLDEVGIFVKIRRQSAMFWPEGTCRKVYLEGIRRSTHLSTLANGLDFGP